MLLSEECNSGCTRIALLGCKAVITALSRWYLLSSTICLQDIDRCILHSRCVCTDSGHVAVCLFCFSNANVTVTLVLHSHVQYSHSILLQCVLHLHIQTRAESSLVQ